MTVAVGAQCELAPSVKPRPLRTSDNGDDEHGVPAPPLRRELSTP